MDFMNQGVRAQILDDIQSEENKQRKAESYRQFEIYRDRQHAHVYNYLLTQFSKTTVGEMPIISSINLAKRIITQQAQVYKKAPERDWTEISEGQDEQIEAIYDAMKADIKLDRSNEYYKLQGQNLIQVLPKDGRLIMRVLLQHQYDAIPDPMDPENAIAYIISAYDPYNDMPNPSTKWNGPFGGQGATNALYNDNYNQKIGDPNDQKSLSDRYVVWTKEFNFLMDGKGNIISESVESPIPGVLPFIDVAYEKDFEYFVRQGQTVTDFSVQYNAALSDLANIVRMQGWGQAYLIAEKDMLPPENLQIGPNYILRLAVDPNSQIRPEFGFAKASPDIAGSIQYVEMLLANFLSSNGIDPKAVSGKSDSNRFSSGVERLLAMVEKFEASQSDYQVYRWVEQKLYQLVKLWNNSLSGTDQLLPEFRAGDIPEDSKVEVEFVKPEAIQTESEKLDSITAQLDIQLISKSEAIAEMRGVSIDRAREILKEIQAEEMGIPETLPEMRDRETEELDS